MSRVGETPYGDPPKISFVDEILGIYKLRPEIITSYYVEAIETAGRVCTAAIAKYTTGSLEYNRATSKPVPYDDGSTQIGLGLTVGPAALFDAKIIETVELGMFIPDGTGQQTFYTLAELREDRIKTGGLQGPRINDPQDLDSFMRGARYIAEQVA